MIHAIYHISPHDLSCVVDTARVAMSDAPKAGGPSIEV